MSTKEPSVCRISIELTIPHSPDWDAEHFSHSLLTLLLQAETSIRKLAISHSAYTYGHATLLDQSGFPALEYEVRDSSQHWMNGTRCYQGHPLTQWYCEICKEYS